MRIPSVWLAWRFFKSNYSLLNLTNYIAIGGLAIGVASLVVSMAVVSGFESTLKQNVIDTMGHVLVIKRGVVEDDLTEINTQLKKDIPEYVALTPFINLKGIIAHNEEVSGVLLEGVDVSSVNQVLNFKHRIIKGEALTSSPEAVDNLVLVGQGIAKRYKLDVGDKFKVVIPKSDGIDPSSLSPKIGEFLVKGIINLGRHEYNQRYIMMKLQDAQKFSNQEGKLSGFRVRLSEDNKADGVASKIEASLSYMGSAIAWENNHSNIFKAIEQERVVIFFVILIIVIAACFNVASALYVNSVKRLQEICILKSLGASEKLIHRVFSFQGMFLGFLGTFLGVVFGFLLCFLFYWAQQKFGLIPASVYNVGNIKIDIRWTDLVSIFTATLVLCYIASYYSARKGTQIQPAEGLKYE